MGIPEEPRMSVEDTVNWLFDSKLSVSKYEALQRWRRNRLRFWQREKLTIIEKEELKLIEFGEQVLKGLKKRYENR